MAFGRGACRIRKTRLRANRMNGCRNKCVVIRRLCRLRAELQAKQVVTSSALRSLNLMEATGRTMNGKCTCDAIERLRQHAASAYLQFSSLAMRLYATHCCPASRVSGRASDVLPQYWLARGRICEGIRFDDTVSPRIANPPAHASTACHTCMPCGSMRLFAGQPDVSHRLARPLGSAP